MSGASSQGRAIIVTGDVPPDATAGCTIADDLDARARQSLGASGDAVYRMIARALEIHGIGGGRLLDVGCGAGRLWRGVGYRFTEYWGLDAVRYDGLPEGVEFRRVDLDASEWPRVPRADVVVAVETIEHLENPWAFMRQLAGHATDAGWVLVSTPNQLSALSLATLLVKRRFSAFQDVHYPAHRTALLEGDLVRIAQAAGLEPVDILYSHHGRLPFTGWHYPDRVAARLPRALSDNVLLVCRRR